MYKFLISQCEVCDKKVAPNYKLKKHLLSHDYQLFYSQCFKEAGVLLSDIGDFLAPVVVVDFDADYSVFIRVKLVNFPNFFQLPDLKEEVVPLIGQHEVEVHVHNKVGVGLDGCC